CQRAGARSPHLVDVAGAFGRARYAPLLARIVRQLDIAVEMECCIRDDASLPAALATAASDPIIDCAALENPDWVRDVIAQHGERIAVGLDVRGTRLAARGWTSDGGELLDVLARLEAGGCPRYVVTDVTK